MADGLRAAVRAALAGFADAGRPLHQAAGALLGALGYDSERTVEGDGDDAAAFVAELAAARELSDRERALLADWRTARIVFQLTYEEIAGQTGLFDRFDAERIESFLFIAVELAPPEADRRYPRARLADMTRAVNRRYPMPAILLFRHGATVTLAAVGRRAHRRDAERDVLQQVTLIKDIRVTGPHRAHLDLLAELALPALRERRGVRSFEQLHREWERVLDAEALNRRFYRELFAWFERAVDTCRFPDDGAGPGNAERHVIRLITRLLFIWFLKEKGLVPEALFTEQFAAAALRNHAPDRTDYYRAVLQNLFFATLNTELGKRAFSGRDRDSHRDFSKYRYAALLSDPDAFLRLLRQVPFVNGGLFDCLDDYEARGAGGRRIDAFTDNVAAQGGDLAVPARLFFAAEAGLFPLFGRYKFTVEENTPLDQEVALDPELLGRVFEHLLAAYNPETRDTARKVTGSYYTPRRVVDYMVDESLAAALAARAEPADGDAGFWRERLRYLLDYADAAADAGELFESGEQREIVRAIAGLRVLDPAVGSGAFPMGVLHKLTLALRRLDPDNRHWEEYQRERAKDRAGAAFDDVDDEDARRRELAEISRTFETYRRSDFGRKLYLIQNGIFGVDVQPVACQIAKLRFFISLVVEQRTTDDPRDNYGIRPLPNLESRFVAADTLLGLEAGDGSDNLLMGQEVIRPIEAHLRRVREGYFNARTRQEKLSLRARDDELRAALARELEDLGYPHEAAAAVARWDPYHQNASAAWFDPEWMFGIADGFDVVIGNPPYVRGEKIPAKARLRAAYGGFYRSTADLYTYFFRRGIDLLRAGGLLCFITSNKFMRADYGRPLREFLTGKAAPRLLLDLGRTGTFDATVRPCIVLAGAAAADRGAVRAATVRGPAGAPDPAAFIERHGFDMEVADLADAGWSLAPPAWQRLRAKIEAAGRPLGEYVKVNGGGIYYGIKTGLNDAFVIDADTRARLIADDPNSADLIRPWLRGKDVRRWQADWADRYAIAIASSANIEWPWSAAQREADARAIFKRTYRAVHDHLTPFATRLRRRQDKGTFFWELRSCAYYRAFDQPKIIYPDIGRAMRAMLDRGRHLAGDTCNIIIPGDDSFLLAILHSKLIDFYFRLALPCLDDPFDGGDLRFKHAWMEHTPIAPAAEPTRQRLAALAEQIQTAKQADPAADVNALQQRLDRTVYDLYGLTTPDIAILEAALPGAHSV